MKVGEKRTLVARVTAAMGFLFGLIGFAMALANHSWKVSPLGWILGGILLLVMALFLLVDGAMAYERHRVALRSIDD